MKSGIKYASAISVAAIHLQSLINAERIYTVLWTREQRGEEVTYAQLEKESDHVLAVYDSVFEYFNNITGGYDADLLHNLLGSVQMLQLPSLSFLSLIDTLLPKKGCCKKSSSYDKQAEDDIVAKARKNSEEHQAQLMEYISHLIAEGYTWIAQDGDGSIHVFDYKPTNEYTDINNSRTYHWVEASAVMKKSHENRRIDVEGIEWEWLAYYPLTHATSYRSSRIEPTKLIDIWIELQGPLMKTTLYKVFRRGFKWIAKDPNRDVVLFRHCPYLTQENDGSFFWNNRDLSGWISTNDLPLEDGSLLEEIPFTPCRYEDNFGDTGGCYSVCELLQIFDEDN